jgi:putative cell wall-binding protein
MGHCSRKPGAERRRFFELKRYFAPIVVNNHARRVVTNKLKRNHNATEFARRFACPLMIFANSTSCKPPYLEGIE